MSISAQNKKIIFGKKIVKVLSEKRPDLIKKIIISKENQYLKKEFGNYFIYEFWTKEKFNKNFPKEIHQNCIAFIKKFKFTEWNDFVTEVKFESKKNNLILIFDRIHNTTNYGSIIRSAVAAGVRYIIVPETGGATINATVAKTSVGSLFSIKILQSNNLIKTIKSLKNLEFLIISTDVSYGKKYDNLNIKNQNIALIVGNENDGVDKKLINESDLKINIPTKNVNSLNVTVATSIILFDIRRQQNFFNK